MNGVGKIVLGGIGMVVGMLISSESQALVKGGYKMISGLVKGKP